MFRTVHEINFQEICKIIIELPVKLGLYWTLSEFI